MGPTGSVGASGRRREVRRGAGGRPGAIALGKGLEHGLHMITTTYLSLAASTSMLAASMLVVGRADRVGCVLCGREGEEGESVFDDHEKGQLMGRPRLLVKQGQPKQVASRQGSTGGQTQQ